MIVTLKLMVRNLLMAMADVSLRVGAQTEDTEMIGAWGNEEAQKSSTWIEAKAVERVLKSNFEILENRKVRWFTKHKNVKNIKSPGNKKSELHSISMTIFIIFESRNE